MEKVEKKAKSPEQEVKKTSETNYSMCCTITSDCGWSLTMLQHVMMP